MFDRGPRRRAIQWRICRRRRSILLELMKQFFHRMLLFGYVDLHKELASLRAFLQDLRSDGWIVVGTIRIEPLWPFHFFRRNSLVPLNL